MTSPTSTNPGVPGASRSAAEGLDIKRVISSSTSDVPIAELSRKGFKQVKVLNQGVIQRLITEAVDRVIAQSARKIGQEERAKVIEQSQSQFEALARERIKRERDRIAELERANAALLKETEELRARLDERDQEVVKLKTEPTESATDKLMEALLKRLPAAGAPGGDIGQLQRSLESISAKLERLPAGGAGGGAYVDKDVVIDALFRDDGTSSAESNISKIKIKQEKAGGVKETLAKLKAMQKGVKDGD